MYATVPLQSSYQASRYLRMGHGDLFANISPQHSKFASTACTNVSGLGQESLYDSEIPAGWQRDDAERILKHMARDFSDGVMVCVSPNPEQLAQINNDGLQIHRSRLDLILAAIDHSVVSAKEHSSTAAYAQALEYFAHQLRIGALVVIKTV